MCHLWNIYKFISYYCRCRCCCCCYAAHRFSPLVFIAAAAKRTKKITETVENVQNTIYYYGIFVSASRLWDSTVSCVGFQLFFACSVSAAFYLWAFSYFCDLRRMFSCHCYYECFRIALCTSVWRMYLNRNYASDLAFNLFHIPRCLNITSCNLCNWL